MYNPNISVFKDLFKSTDVPFARTLEQVIERIKSGSSKELITKIRDGEKDLKKRLPSIIFAGEFSERNRNGLVKHSGLMVVDFDKYPDKKVMRVQLEELKENDHFITLFISPSGNGIKGVVRVPDTLTKESHPKYFKAFQKKFDFKYFDMANSNVDRVCFESYDPEIYVNQDAKVFETDIIDDGFEKTERVPMIPINDEEKIIDKIANWRWNTSFTDGQRNQHIFSVAGAFCEFGVTPEAAEGYITGQVVSGDFTEREAVNAVKSAYKTRDFNSKYFEDYSRIDRVKKDLKNGRDYVMKRHNIDEQTYEQIKEEQELQDFWYYNLVNKKPKIQVSSWRFKEFLHAHGFKKYYPADSNEFIWVRIKSFRVEIISVSNIKDYVIDYLDARKEIEAWEKCSKTTSMFQENYLNMIGNIELNLLQDTKYESFIAYNNGVLRVTKDSTQLIDFMDAGNYIWEKQIRKRDYHLKNKEVENDYRTFVHNVADGEVLALECTIGYLMSTYKDRMINKAIILNDEVISENPEGGTGKGLFMQGLEQVRKVDSLDGKRFKDDSAFAFQTVTEETQILVFDDVKKNFSFESKFSLITEGITLERKNKDAVKLPVKKSPKVVISTNYAIKGAGNSHDRRRHEIELMQYYNAKRTPMDEFGKEMFGEEWTEDDWMRFDTYMIECLQKYLTHGLIEQQSKNVKIRKFIAESSMVFYEWVGDDENVPVNTRNSKRGLYEQFLRDDPDAKKWLSMKVFMQWIKKYAALVGHGYKDYKSNGLRSFSYEAEKTLKNIEI